MPPTGGEKRGKETQRGGNQKGNREGKCGTGSIEDVREECRKRMGKKKKKKGQSGGSWGSIHLSGSLFQKEPVTSELFLLVIKETWLDS